MKGIHHLYPLEYSHDSYTVFVWFCQSYQDQQISRHHYEISFFRIHHWFLRWFLLDLFEWVFFYFASTKSIQAIGRFSLMSLLQLYLFDRLTVHISNFKMHNSKEFLSRITIIYFTYAFLKKRALLKDMYKNTRPNEKRSDILSRFSS